MIDSGCFGHVCPPWLAPQFPMVSSTNVDAVAANNIALQPYGQKGALSSTFTRQKKLINVTQCARCVFPRHWITGPVSVRISRNVFQGLVQVIWFQCRYRQIEIQFTCSSQISQHFLGTYQMLVTRVCMTSILSRTSDLVSLR